jgi:hypothetical protein
MPFNRFVFTSVFLLQSTQLPSQRNSPIIKEVNPLHRVQPGDSDFHRDSLTNATQQHSTEMASC